MERERLQIQVIRQLDLEDLEVEEVDHSDEDDTDDEPDEEYALFPSQYNSDTSPPPPSSAEFNFDTYIAPSHTYLGDVEDTRHRIAFLDGGAILNLPLFCLRGVVLFPGATLPLRVIEPRLVAAVERALTQDDIPYTIGVIRIHRDIATRRTKSASIGTTAGVFQKWFCNVQYFIDLCFYMWKRMVGMPDMDSLIKKPDVLSFHIASKIPVSESTRQEFLDIDSIAYRLRREIELLESIDLIRCKSCETIIAKRSDMLIMSSEGPLSAYVNSGGYVHEIMTLYKANGLALTGSAVADHSWFPGYAWTIATCATCKKQIGWLFTARNKQLKPSSFWGIRSCQLAEEIRQNL
ncbi:protein cereblon-like [Glycine soja]|nr:protein cereblon-like [Glycine soja]|eukprot:XP_006582488.1 protein cereblon [Glycine max]